VKHTTIVNNWRGFLVEDLVEQDYFDSSSINEELLNEIGADTFKDVAQYIIGALVEYGIIGGSAGLGTPMAAAAETALDALFSAEAIVGAIDEISQIGARLEEYQQLWDTAMASWKGSFDTFYQTIRKLVQKIFQDLGTKAGEGIDQIADKLKEMISSLIGKLLRPIKKGIQLIIPEASIGVAAATAFGQMIESAADSMYDTLISLISKFEVVKNFVINPDSAIEFFGGLFEKLEGAFREGAAKFRDRSFLRVLIPGNTAAELAKQKLYPRVADSVAEKLKTEGPKILEIFSGILNTLIPSLLGAAAIMQILLKGEYKGEPEVTQEKIHNNWRDFISEKELTKPEKKEKEKIVKGMKKDKKGFKQRYGDDAESVMYATATKLAKEKK
jgi:hypothetical protein